MDGCTTYTLVERRLVKGLPPYLPNFRFEEEGYME